MSIAAPQHVYMLVNGVLDEGLAFVTEYVENMLQRPVVITDCNGRIHYPENADPAAKIDALFMPLPKKLSGRDFYYQPEDRILYYRVRYNSESAYLIVPNQPPEQIAPVLNVLMETKLAVKCYFSKIHRDCKRFESEMAEYLFTNSNASIRDIVKLGENRMEWDRSYLVSLVEIEEETKPDKLDKQLLRAYFCEYLEKDKFDVIPISWGNYLLFIIPVCLPRERGGEKSDWTRLISYKHMLEQKFNLFMSMGIGQIYPLADLQKSFKEARIVLTLSRMLGKRHFVQRFTDLGIYYPIFSQEPRVIKQFCSNTLGPLLEHDGKTDGELLPTLRKLLDSGGNMKSTADSLFIHVNTLYYRINKIEELLGMDFSSMDTRVNLFIAVKVWDTLHDHGWFDRN